jgi:dipeptidyl aminopeptidase/acylaminoacyl peptidase
VPLWLIHGVRDAQAPIKESEELVQATVKAGGASRFTPLPDRDHSILDWCDKAEISDRLLEQRRSANPAAGGEL